MIGFLDLPLEIREQIYALLLILTDPTYHHHNSPATLARKGIKGSLTSFLSFPHLYPAILSTCSQIYHEALPYLYTKNTFRCHEKLLTSFPKLHHLPFPGRQPYPSLSETTCPGIKLIRRWFLHARLDTGPFWDVETVSAALTGADELELQVWQSMFSGECGTEVLQMFEGVRGVRKVKIWGSTTGLEAYAAWLRDAMMTPVGSEVVPYQEDRNKDKVDLGWRIPGRPSQE